jgi:hypothetical protein
MTFMERMQIVHRSRLTFQLSESAHACQPQAVPF